MDFYNACKAYYAAENGSIEQREAILDIFSIGFDFAEGKIPSWLGGCIVDQGCYLMDLVDELGENTFITEIIQHSSMDYAMDCYAPNADSVLSVYQGLMHNADVCYCRNHGICQALFLHRPGLRRFHISFSFPPQLTVFCLFYCPMPSGTVKAILRTADNSCE